MVRVAPRELRTGPPITHAGAGRRGRRSFSLIGAGAETVIPYGLVVRNPAESPSYTLPASPDADPYHGLVGPLFRFPV